MPLVSEGLIQKAYGPLDLSKFYNAIDSYAKQAAAEAKAQKIADLKEYNTNIASLTKGEASGMRSIDIPKATEYYNGYANAAKQQIADPHMITNNPEKYSQLEKTKAEYLGKHKALVSGSKELAKKTTEFTGLALHPTTKTDYRPNALEDWQKNVDNTPYEDVVKNGSADYSKYFRTDVDESKFDDKFTANVKDAKLILPIDIKTTENGINFIQKNEYKDFPDIAKIFQGFTQATGSAFGKPGSETEKQFFAQKAKNLNADDIASRWDNLTDAEHIKKYNHPKPKLTKEVLDPTTGKMKSTWGDTEKERVTNLIVADTYLRNLPTFFNKTGKKDFDSPTGRMDYSSELGFNKAMRLLDARLKKLGTSTSNFDISSTFGKIGAGGKAGYETAENLVNYLNENPVLGATANMVSTSTAGDKSSVFKKSDEILSEAVPDMFKQGKLTFKDAGDDEKNKTIAAALTKKNFDNGLTNVKISPESLKSGKVISLRFVDKGVASTYWFDAQDKESIRNFNKTIRASIESKKQKAQAAMGAELVQDSLGLFNN